MERWLAPVLNYIPTRNAPATSISSGDAPAPANDISVSDPASHPPGCGCAFHLQYRKKAIGAG